MAVVCLKTSVAALLVFIFCGESSSLYIDQGSEVATFQLCPNETQPVFVNLSCSIKLSIIRSTPLVAVEWKDITTTPSVDVVTISNSTTVTKSAAYQHLNITRLTNDRLDGSIRLQIENMSPGSLKIFNCEASAVNDNPGWTSRPVVVYNNATCPPDDKKVEEWCSDLLGCQQNLTCAACPENVGNASCVSAASGNETTSLESKNVTTASGTERLNLTNKTVTSVLRIESPSPGGNTVTTMSETAIPNLGGNTVTTMSETAIPNPGGNTVTTMSETAIPNPGGNTVTTGPGTERPNLGEGQRCTDSSQCSSGMKCKNDPDNSNAKVCSTSSGTAMLPTVLMVLLITVLGLTGPKQCLGI